MAVIKELLLISLMTLTLTIIGLCSDSKRYRTGGYGGQVHPTSSDDLPIIDLIESPNRIYDPKPSDIDDKLLMERLGDGFDSRFMSSIDPSLSTSFVNDTTTIISNGGLKYVRNKKGMLVPIGKMPKHVRKFKFKFLHMADGRRVRTKVTQRLRRKLRQFLWTYTHCPLIYSWKDLGIRFWPRWLREGHCFNSVRSCSFPQGMICKPSKSLGKMVLRWHCQDWDRSRYCKWIPVSYPVITGCKCSC